MTCYFPFLLCYYACFLVLQRSGVRISVSRSDLSVWFLQGAASEGVFQSESFSQSKTLFNSGGHTGLALTSVHYVSKDGFKLGV